MFYSKKIYLKTQLKKDEIRNNLLYIGGQINETDTEYDFIIRKDDGRFVAGGAGGKMAYCDWP